jgi:hypothetical protein
MRFPSLSNQMLKKWALKTAASLAFLAALLFVCCWVLLGGTGTDALSTGEPGYDSTGGPYSDLIIVTATAASGAIAAMLIYAGAVLATRFRRIDR